MIHPYHYYEILQLLILPTSKHDSNNNCINTQKKNEKVTNNKKSVVRK